MSSRKPSYVYVLTDEPNCKWSYVGWSVDVEHRRRQHNGDIARGAKSTRKFKGKARVAFHIGPFINKSRGLMFEAAMKAAKRPFEKGFPRTACVRRTFDLEFVLASDRWTRRAPRSKFHPTLTICWSRLFRETYPEVFARCKLRLDSTSQTQLVHENVE